MTISFNCIDFGTLGYSNRNRWKEKKNKNRIDIEVKYKHQAVAPLGVGDVGDRRPPRAFGVLTWIHKRPPACHLHDWEVKGASQTRKVDVADDQAWPGAAIGTKEQRSGDLCYIVSSWNFQTFLTKGWWSYDGAIFPFEIRNPKKL